MNDLYPTDDARWLERVEQILALARRLRAMLEERIADRGISEPELALLWACVAAPRGGIDQRELARTLAVSTSQVSVLVERLFKAGILHGRIDPADRRRRLWEPTDAGVELWRSIADGPANIDLHRGAA